MQGWLVLLAAASLKLDYRDGTIRPIMSPNHQVGGPFPKLIRLLRDEGTPIYASEVAPLRESWASRNEFLSDSLDPIMVVLAFFAEVTHRDQRVQKIGLYAVDKVQETFCFQLCVRLLGAVLR